jgi:hypothetical protein
MDIFTFSIAIVAITIASRRKPLVDSVDRADVFEELQVYNFITWKKFQERMDK